ncbi:MAG: Rieske (2Fe-2S) protein [Pseudonocardiales bacterium]|nr:Rieske (2Fe-2S) protein [Pseudonocardiales bacterium]
MCQHTGSRHPHHESELARRAVVAGPGVLVAAAALAACASNTDQGAAAGAGKRLASTGDIPVGGGTVFASKKIVVTQPVPGTFRAFSAICTHQGCLVTTVADGTIDCPCHGSRYAIADGSVVGGPAPRPLPQRPITVWSGEILLE